ncbi:MAG TPA: N-methyl-L-tryptophan oxidase [Acidimicrobiales bacterium]|nr:N-methyl-L-tryptophan oxidase [Acidimicrobiales bacterium]
MRVCDVVVIGAGVMGSATAWWLARAGRDVVLLEQFEAGHVRASSHGSTRIFRLAYPDAGYIEMARSALPLWRELEEDAGVELLVTTGGIDYGAAESVRSLADALQRTAVPHDVIDPSDAAARWPGFAFAGPVLYQPDAGRLWADEAVRALHRQAGTYGAAVRFEEPVRAVVPANDDQVLVTTDADEYRARVAVVTAGAWVSSLLTGVVELPILTVTREQVFHFPTRLDGDAGWPSYIHHSSGFIYGLQGHGDEGIKVAEHHRGAITTADGRSFAIDQAGRQRVVNHVRTNMPGLDPTPTSATTCLYTTTADESFVIERHGPIVVGSPCSGHGFKFAPLIGRHLAHLAMAAG